VARGFVRRGDELVAALTPPERVVVAQLAGDVVELLAGEDVDEADTEVPGDAQDPLEVVLEAISRPAARPADPALLLLLPDATDEPEAAEEFRRYTEDELRHRKVSRLLDLGKRMLACDPDGDADTPYELVVALENAEEVAAAMTDLRLVLASRLGIADDDQAAALYDELVEPSEGEDVRHFIGAAFVLLGALQESLTECLLADLPARPPGRRPSNR